MVRFLDDEETCLGNQLESEFGGERSLFIASSEWLHNKIF